MAQQKGESVHKENDRMISLGTSAIYKRAKLSEAISKELAIEGVKESVMEYIFGGDEDATSPLAEIRKEHK